MGFWFNIILWDYNINNNNSMGVKQMIPGELIDIIFYGIVYTIGVFVGWYLRCKKNE